jgi:ethanolaminephosphotransferase
MMGVSGYYGPGIWATPLLRPFPFLSPLLSPTTTLRDLWVPLLLGGFLMIHLPACVANVHAARRSRGQPTLPLLAEWTPMLVFVASCAAWLGSPRSTLLSGGHLNLFCYAMSLVFGRMTTKIILAHLTRQPFPLWTVLLAPLAGGALLANARALGLPALDVFAKPGVEIWYLRGYFVFAAVVYAHWAHLVITSICDYLGINCLTIPHSKWAALASQTPLGAHPVANGNSPKKD